MLALGTATPSFAAPKTTFTPSARASMDMVFPSRGFDYYNQGAGFSVGAYGTVETPSHIWAEAGVAMTFFGMSNKDFIPFSTQYDYDGTATSYGLRIPLMAGYNFILNPDASLRVGAGLWGNISLTAQQNISPNFESRIPLPEVNVNLMHEGWQHFDPQAALSITYTYASNYSIGINAAYGLSPMFKMPIGSDIYRANLGVSLGYNF